MDILDYHSCNERIHIQHMRFQTKPPKNNKNKIKKSWLFLVKLFSVNKKTINTLPGYNGQLNHLVIDNRYIDDIHYTTSWLLTSSLLLSSNPTNIRNIYFGLPTKNDLKKFFDISKPFISTHSINIYHLYKLCG